MSILNYPLQTECLLVYLHVSHTYLLIFVTLEQSNMYHFKVHKLLIFPLVCSLYLIIYNLSIPGLCIILAFGLH